MDLRPTEQQTLVKDSAVRFLREQYSFERRRQLIAEECPRNPGQWSKLVDLGWPGAWLPESDGGIGGSEVEFSLIMEEMGRHLYVGPYAAATMANALLRHGGSARARELFVAGVEGRRMTLAHIEPGGRGIMDRPRVQATKSGSGYVLSGRKRLVYSGRVADDMIVTAMVSDGPAVFVVSPDDKNMTMRHYRTVDNDWASDVEFDRAQGEILIGPDGYDCALDDAIFVGLLGVGAEAVGICEATFHQTKLYLGERKQFGRPLIEFQALQHRLAALYVEIEALRWTLLDALSHIAVEHKKRACAAFGLKIQAGTVASAVAGQCLHLHGGMGMTDELPISHYYKRARMIEAQFGNTDYFIAAYTKLMD